jgi:hypothetical protein
MRRYAGRCLSGLLLLVAILAGCRKSDEPAYVLGKDPDIDERSLDPGQLHGDPVFTYEAIGQATAIAYQDGVLWIGDNTGDPFIHLVDIRRATPLRSIGRHGDGPGDFHSVFGFSVRPDDNGLWAFDVSRRRLTRIAVDTKVPPEVISIPIRAVQARWLDRARILAVGPSDTDRFAVFDSTGVLLRRGPGPLLGPDSVPLRQRLETSSQVKLCANPDGTAFALFYMDGGRAEIYDTLLQRQSELPVPFPSQGVFSRNKQSHAWEVRAPRMYYVSCTATRTYLYAVFSGRHSDFEHHIVQANSRFVHVFDWTGHFLRAYRLDHDAMAIASDGDSVLYAMSAGSDTVHRYHLPSLGNSAQ